MRTNTKKRHEFEWFKSETCHRVKREGDLNFIINVLESGEIRELFEMQWYPESLYLLAMVDYLSRENDLPICSDYADIRNMKMEKIIYPLGVFTRSYFAKNDYYLHKSVEEAIPEFIRHNIVEAEVRNVC